MCPTLSFSDQFRSADGNLKGLRKRSKRSAGLSLASQLDHICIRELRQRFLPPSRSPGVSPSALCAHVTHVLLRPNKQVARVAARRVVARVQYVGAIGDWAVGHHPRKPTRDPSPKPALLGRAVLAVSVSVAATGPRPALAGSPPSNARPKPLHVFAVHGTRHLVAFSNTYPGGKQTR